MSLHLHNSLTRTAEEFVPISPKRTKLYTCGPTVYNYAHIGNYRAYVFEDLLKRVLRYCGHRVVHVMNLTDVDDKTIRGSRRAGLSLDDFTQKYKDAFFADVATLRIDPADVYPAATEHVGDMIAVIQKLMAKGVAYQAEDGSVYFSIDKFPEYGRLARIDRAQLRPGARVKHDEYAKESAADFALWKAWDEADGEVQWDSPWGKGRPGWHIECSAMSSRYLGKTFDIHCGGIDNLFPHHEDEIAQSEAANGCTFVHCWLHCAHLVVDGAKMSKSLENFYTLGDLTARGYNGRELRWVLCGTHYRQALNFSFKACDDARASLQRIDDVVRRLKETSAAGGLASPELEAIMASCEAAFRASLEDDLSISSALAALFDLVRDVNRLMDAGSLGEGAGPVLDQLRSFDTVLAVLDVDREDDIPPDVLALAEERSAAREARDFSRADIIRDSLQQQGWTVEDTPSGPRIKRA